MNRNASKQQEAEYEEPEEALEGEEEGEEEQQGMSEEERLERLDAMGDALCSLRAEAIAGRAGSGIERIWLEDEEFYEGIDELNRSEVANLNWATKVPGQSFMRGVNKTRSTVFPNITGPFVDAAAARIADMLLPTDDRPWKIEPTPDPELEGAVKTYREAKNGMANADGLEDQPAIGTSATETGLSEGERQVAKDTFIGKMFAKPVYSQAANEEVSDPARAEEILAEARDKADKTQRRIEDWHVECQWHTEVRKVIEDAARIGVGVLKGPVPKAKKRVKWRGKRMEMDPLTGDEYEAPGKMDVQVDHDPISKWVDPWDFFPDPHCGEDIQNGYGTWERSRMSKRQVRDLLKDNSYIPQALMKVLKEGPIKAGPSYERQMPGDVASDQTSTRGGQYEVWFFHGSLEREELEACGCDVSDLEDPYVDSVVTIINNHVVKAVQAPLDHGGFPYDVYPWRRRSGHWSGIGVGRQIRVAQQIVVNATRNLMDNAGIAAGPMFVFKHGVVHPADGVASMSPRKVWYIKYDDETIQRAQDAIGTITVDMLTDDLLKIVEFGMKLAEDTTGLPMLLQGQMGAAPDTVGGMTMLNNNATAVLRRLARLFDDKITEPHLRRYYIWHLQYGNDEEKGDIQIDATGSSAMVERDIQNQELGQMHAIVLDPRFGMDPKKWAQEWLKSRHFDPKRLNYDDEQWQQLMSEWMQLMQMKESMADPRVEVEKIRGQNRLQEVYAKGEMDGAIQLARQDHEMNMEQLGGELDIILKNMDQQVVELGEAAETNRAAMNAKTALSKEIMKIRSTMRLANMKAPADSMPKPPIEPKGRAPAGESYQK